MAISIRGTATAWVAATATTQTVTLPTHAAGDMLLVRVAFKHATMPTTVTCGTSGWTKLGQYNNGTTVSGNGLGSVVVAVFYMEATQAGHANPVITYHATVAATPSAATAIVYQKGASEAWVTPVGAGGPVNVATAISSTITSHISTTAGDMVDFFLSQGDNNTLTVPTFTQAGLTLGTVAIAPATALNSATSNDIDATGGYRLVSSGTSSAAAVVTATAGAADQGSAWTTRLRVVAVSTYSGTFTADAAIAKTTIGTVTADAYVKKTVDVSGSGEVLTVHDGFSGSSGTLNGRTPDTVGSMTWTTASALVDGIGSVGLGSAGDTDSIDAYLSNTGADGRVYLAWVTMDSGVTLSAIFRRVDASNYLKVTASAGGVTLAEVVSGTPNTLGTYATGPAASIEVSYVGSTVRVYVDVQTSPVITVSTSRFQSATAVGLAGFAPQNSYGAITTFKAWAGTAGTNFTADAEIGAQAATTYNGTFTADSYVSKATSGTFVANAIVSKADISGSFIANAAIKKADISGSFTANAQISKTTAGTFTANAHVSKVTAGTFTANAHVSKVIASTFTANSWVSKTASGSATADAWVSKTTSGSVTADSWVGASPQGSFTADAEIAWPTISGTMYAGGVPVPNGNIWLYTDADAYYGYTACDINGHYSIAVPPGGYKFHVQSGIEGYAIQFYGGHFSLTNATIFDTSSGSVVADLNLMPTVNITGTMFCGSTPSPAGTSTVWVYRASDNAYYTGFTLSASDGSFSFPVGLGDYKFWLTPGVAGYPDQAYSPFGLFALATVVSASADTVVNLTPLAGRVFGGVLHLDGVPHQGVVHFFDEFNGTYLSSVATDVDGAFSFNVFALRYKILLQFTDHPDREQFVGWVPYADTPVFDLTSGDGIQDLGSTAFINGSITADAIIATLATGSFTAEAWLSRVTSGTFSANAVVSRTGISGSFTADAVISKAYAASITANAFVKRTLPGALLADAVVSKAYPFTFTANSYIRSTRSGTFTAQSFIQKTTSGSITANANVLRAYSGAVTADAWIKGVPSGSFTADAFVVKTFSSTFSADAWVKSTLSGSVTANAHVSAVRSGSFSADAWIAQTGVIAGSFSANAIISRSGIAGSVTADAYVGKLISGSFTANAMVLKVASGSLTANSNIRRDGVAGSLTANAYVSKVLAGTFAANSWLSKTNTSSFTSNAWVTSVVAGSISANAWIASTSTVAGTFTADAIVKRDGLTGSFAANASIRRTFSGTFAADGYLKSTLSGTVVANAWLRGTLLGAFSADAHVQRTLAGTFTASANIRKISTWQFTADGYISGVVSSAFSAEAWISNPNAVKIVIGHATKVIMFRTLQGKTVGYDSDPSKTVVAVATDPTLSATLDGETNIAGPNLLSETEKL